MTPPSTPLFSRLLGVSLFLCLLTSPAALGVEFPWDNSAGDNDFSNPSNWAGNNPPVAGSSNYALIDLTGSDKCVFSGGTSVNMAGLHIGYEGTDGEFEQTGGSLVATSNSNGATRVGRNGESGMWTMSGGTASINAIQPRPQQHRGKQRNDDCHGRRPHNCSRCVQSESRCRHRGRFNGRILRDLGRVVGDTDRCPDRRPWDVLRSGQWSDEYRHWLQRYSRRAMDSRGGRHPEGSDR